ncbi:MAG: T9SS type A sorting domain-containing protein [Flavobacterium sp.]|nr:T9SS type A sorting domain-containing protein [Flavobacterium sp.]
MQFTAVNSGSWNNKNTWANQILPQDGDIVYIPANITVDIVRREVARIKYINIEGKLEMKPNFNTSLFVETISVAKSGALVIGTKSTPISPNLTTEITFLDNGVITNPTLTDRGLIVMGTCTIYGSKKTGYVSASDASIGATSIQVNGTIGSFWKIGDQIVIPSTVFNPGNLRLVTAGAEEKNKPSPEAIASSFQDEKVTITGISGNTIQFSPALKYNHIRPKATLPFHIANLTRNVIFKSENDEISRRGHTMFMNGSKVEIEGASFYQLGRTNKRNRLDDLLEITQRGPNRGKVKANDFRNIKNHRGRYAVHFHRGFFNMNDLNTPLASVTNCVVEDTPGWGYVNHSSHVNFKDNVCYNFTGSGFVTESGDELGTFENNIAIQGHGNGELRARRLGFNTPTRSPSINDFGFSGDGFWLQGTAVRVINNIAISCNGSGIIFFTTGSVDDTYAKAQSDFTYSRFVGFGDSIAKKLYPALNSGNFRPRIIKTGYTQSEGTVYLISDFPILEARGNIVYASHTGYSQRFNNNSNSTFYKQLSFDYNRDFVTNGTINYQSQNVSNHILWNNFIAMSTSYSSKTNFTNFEIYNGVRRNYTNYDDQILDWAIAGTHSSDMKYRNFSIEGYGLGGLLNTNGNDIVEKNNILNTAYIQHKLKNREDRGDNDVTSYGTCAAIDYNSSRWNNDNSIRINFTSDVVNQKQIAVRYKTTNAIYWTYKTLVTKEGYVNLPVTNSNQAYEFQVLRGCNSGVSSKWSQTGTIQPRNSNNTKIAIADNILAYPNPAIAELTIEFNAIEENGEVKSLEIYNYNGLKVINPTITSKDKNSKIIDVSNFENGIYIIEITYENGKTSTKKIMVSK